MAYIRSLLDRVCSIEKWTLIGFVIAAFLILSFAVLASEVAEGETRAFDERILLMFRIPGDLSRTIGPPWLKEAVRDITALGGTSVLAIIVAGVVGFLAVSGVRHAAIMVLTSVLSGVSLSNGLKVGFSRARPDLVPHDTVIYTASFPSGHATLSAVVYSRLAPCFAARNHPGP